MKRGLQVIISVFGALAALTLALISVAVAGNTPLGGSINDTRPALPPLRPHAPQSGVYILYDTLTPSDVPTATYDWIEIRDSYDYIWDLQGGFGIGDVSPSFPIGFYFAFYDDFYTHFRISENGYIFFEKPGVNVGSGSGLPGTIPDGSLAPGTDAINNFIAPFASDLVGYPGVSYVYVKNDSSPRRAIIEFENMVWCCGPYNPRTFQIILYPSGAIEMQYRKITNFAGTLDEDMNQIIRVGLENLDGTAGDVYIQGLFIPDASDFWQDEMTIRFERTPGDVSAIFLPDSQRIWDDPGRSIIVTSDLYLNASPSITRSFNLTYTLDVSSSLPLSTWASGITYPPSAVATGTYSTTQQFVAAVPATAGINDVATATFTAESTGVPVVTATFTLIYGPAHRDLQIQKTLDPNIPPAQEGAFRYRLVITNTDFNDSDRGAMARGVVMTDVLPVNVTYEDCRRAPQYERCGPSVMTDTLGAQTAITLNLGTMGIDEVETVWLELRNSHNSGSNANNTAHVTTTDSVELGYGPNNHDSESFTVAITQSELHINKDYPYPYHDRNLVAAGQAIPFNIRFYNDGRDGHTGNAPLYDVVIVDTLPESTTFNHATLDYHGPDLLSAEGPITPAIGGPMSRALTFIIPVVDNGSWNYADLQLWVNIPQTIPIGTRLTNTVTIDDESSSDNDIEVVEITGNYVDPFVDKGPSRDAQGNVILPEPGKDYTYWITYGNRSLLTDAINVIITDTLPPSVTLVSASPARYLTGPVISALPGDITQLTWYTDTAPGIPRGRMGQIAIVVHVADDVPQGIKLVNQVVITYSGDFTPSTTMDDTDVLTLEIASVLHSSHKLVNNRTPNAGDTIRYTIVVSNAGPDTLSFTVADPLPPELSYADHTPPSTGDVVTSPNHILWTGGSVGPSSEETLTFRATITEAAQISDVIRNTAHITSGEISIQRWVEVTISPPSGGDIYLPTVIKN